MGKVFKHDFFEVYVFTKDHGPAHFHVYFPKKSNAVGFIKVLLERNSEDLEIMDLENVGQKDLGKLEKFLTKQRIEILISEWEGFHGEI